MDHRPPCTDAEVIEFLRERSIPCPRCSHDLRDSPTAKCPECGEPLVLKVGSPKARFGWLVLSMAPGCFSGVMACVVAIPVVATIGQSAPPGQGCPWPIVAADAFGFLSAASLWLMYKHRHRVMSWTTRQQAGFMGVVWGVHFLMLALVILSMFLWY